MTAEEFTRLALVEIQRRGVENAKRVGAVMDGAEWEQGFVDRHRPDALRILDFPHAGEHISPIGEFLWGEGTPEMKQWVGERLHQLKHEGPAGLLTVGRRIGPKSQRDYACKLPENDKPFTRPELQPSLP